MTERSYLGLLALDIDGTLVGPDGDLGDRTLRAVNNAGEHGWLVTIATGRSWRGAHPVAERLDLRVPLVIFNGAVIRDSVTAEIVDYHPLAPQVSSALVDALRERDVQPIVVEDIRRGERMFAGPPENDSPQVRWWLDRLSERQGIEIVRVGYDELGTMGHAVRVMLYEPPERANAIARLVDELPLEYRVLPSDDGTREGRLIQFLHPSSNKATALSTLAHRYGMTMTDVVAVGDGINDIEMLAEAGYGVAMGNASDEVRDYADFTIGDHRDEGLADFIERQLLAERGALLT